MSSHRPSISKGFQAGTRHSLQGSSGVYNKPVHEQSEPRQQQRRSLKAEGDSYDKDFYAWTKHHAMLIRRGKLSEVSEVDLAHIAEEIESMGRRDKRELISCLAILLAHLLKWQHQPERRGNSWKYTIKEQRFELIELLKESPSLKQALAKQLAYAYRKALLIAIKETGINRKRFPKDCPFPLTQSLSTPFFPNE